MERIGANAADAYGNLLTGPTPTTISGLQAIRLEASGTNSEGDSLQGRTAVLFDEATWYVILCQFIREDAEKMKPGCDQVLESFRVE